MAGANPQMLIRIAASLDELKRNLAEGRQQIEVTTAGMQKLAASLDGSKLEQRANNITAAINDVGGASKLTDAEARRLLPTLDAWIEKGQRMGKEIPPDILKTRDALVRVDEAMQVEKWQGKLTSFGSAATTVGFGLTAGLTAPILAVGGAAIKLGMDAVESRNLVEVSFGDMTGAADAWAQSLSKNLGLNRFETEKMAGTLFNMTSSMGLTKTAAFDMSTGVVKLAADMASFRNIPMEEALTKIKSGLTGEAEPLKAIGILVNDATIKTYAYANGLAKQGAELTEQQKVMARWGAILKQTSNDQGDLARTLDSPANQLRIMKSRLEEAATALGMQLMPLVSKFIGIAADLVPYIQRAVEWFTALPQPVQMGVVAVAALAAAIGPIVLVLGGIATSIASLLPVLATMGITVGAVTTAMSGAGIAAIAFGAAIGGWQVGSWIAKLKLFGDAQMSIGESFEFGATKLTNWARGIKASDADIETAILSRRKLETSTKDTAVATEDATAAFTRMTKGLSDSAGPSKEATKAAAAHAKELQGITDKLTGAGAIKAANDYLAAIRRVPGDLKMTAAAQADVNKVMGEALTVYEAQGRTAPEAIRRLWFETIKVPPVVNLTAAAVQQLGERFKVTIPQVEEYGLKFKVVEGISLKAGYTIGQSIDVVPPKVRKTTDSIGELAQSLAQMATIAGESFGAVLQGIGTMVAAFDTARQSQEAFAEGQKEFGDTDGSKVQGLMGMASGIMGMASSAIAAGKALKGMWDHFFGAAGRSVVEGFAETMGGFDAMHQRLLTLGASGEALWVKLTQGVGRNNPEQAKKVIEEINAALAGQDAWMQRLPGLIEKYGLSWEQAGQQAKQAHLDEIARGLIQDFADLSKAGFDVTLVTEKMGGAINDYIAKAIRTGTEIPAAMKPLLQKMIDMGVLTDDAGLAITDLGNLKFAETLTEGFKTVVEAIKELTRALTGDLGGALESLSQRKVVIPVGFDVDDLPGRGADTAATGGLVGYGKILPFDRGGLVNFSPVGTDTVPAMLTPGEIVLNAAQQRNVAGDVSGSRLSTAAMEAKLASIERLLRDQPRAMAIAAQDAVVLAVRR